MSCSRSAITRDLDWGVPIPLDGWESRTDKRIYVLVRRGDRLPVGVGRVGPPHRRPRRGGSGGATRRPGHYYFMGKDNIVFHSVIWPSILLGYDGLGGRGGAPRPARRAPAADRGGQQRVPHDGGPQVLVLALRGSSTCATSWPATTPTRCAISSPRRAGGAGHRLHLGGIPAPQQRRAGRRLVPWSTARSRWRPRTSAPSPS